jgi:hypothetical protein
MIVTDFAEVNQLINTNFVDYKNIINDKLSNKKHICRINNYQIYSPHYSLDDFREKSGRRIERFYKTINSNDSILFLRKYHLDETFVLDDIHKFVQIIKNINKNCNFTLLIVIEGFLSESDRNRDRNRSSIIPNVIIEELQLKEKIPCDLRKDQSAINIWKNILHKHNILTMVS